ncbi:MAG TPA: HAMP domain-containing sensor histidine kinase [bacterium]|nr:HAMP domain-containing sensor histidine kinase [bacterium]
MILRRITLYFLILFLLVGVGLFTYSNALINRLENEYRSISIAYADVSSTIITAVTRGDVSLDLLKDITDSLRRMLKFPAIVVSADGKQMECRNLPGDLHPVDAASRLEILRLAAEMDEDNDPIPLVERRVQKPTGTVEERLVATLHYSSPEIITTLSWLPVVGIAFILIFGGLGLFANHRFRLSEQQAIWVGLAKETAHQLGTPVSSLLGWLELLREDPAAVGKVQPEMTRDVKRLEQIVHRFAEVGRTPELEKTDLRAVVREAVEYCRKRISLANVKLVDESEDVGLVPLSAVLFGWVIENLVRNAAEVLANPGDGGKKGRRKPGRGLITVRLRRVPRGVELEVSDTGAGMNWWMRRRVFDAGHSTKARGWGLGLTLVRRIIVEYHHGRIRLKSSPGEGTRFTITLPV